MSISVFDLFSVGIGPSSSHTVGPMRAALRFVSGLRETGLLPQTHSLKAELYGSLGATGKAHGSDKAVVLGLEGESPETIDPRSLSARLNAIRERSRISLLGVHEIVFRESDHLVFHRRQSLPHHPNGMRFNAYADGGIKLHNKVYYSVGGGFVVDEEAAGADRLKQDDTRLPYPFKSGAELLELCAKNSPGVVRRTFVRDCSTSGASCRRACVTAAAATVRYQAAYR